MSQISYVSPSVIDQVGTRQMLLQECFVNSLKKLLGSYSVPDTDHVYSVFE